LNRNICEVIKKFCSWSLEHVLDEDFHALDGANSSLWNELGEIGGILSAEEFVNELSIGLVLDIELSSLEVIELVVLVHLSGYTLSSEEPDSLDLEELAVGLLSDNCV
jgi:hypothetical protein